MNLKVTLSGFFSTWVGPLDQAVGELKDLLKHDHISAGQQRQEDWRKRAGMFKYNEKQLWSTEMNDEEGSGLATLRPEAVLQSLGEHEGQIPLI